MAQTIEKIRLESTDRKNEDGASRLTLAKSMIRSGDREIFLETDERPFAPKSIAAINGDGEVLGYLPKEVTEKIYDDVLMAEDDDDEEEITAKLFSADDNGIVIEFDMDALPEYDEKPEQEKEPQKKNKNPAGYALIAIIAFYLAYRLFTKSGG